MSSKPRIVVTGANGQLGWELARRLDALGEVVSVTRDVLDFTHPVRVESSLTSLRPSLIVNAAAYTAVDKAESDEGMALKVNSEAVAAIGRAARNVGASVMHFSTDYVFDGEASAPYVETDRANPINAYGRSKLAGERMLAQTGADHLIIRTSWVYSARGHNFMRTMLRLAHEREELNVVSDQVGTPTWAGWLAEAAATIVAQQLAKRTDTGRALFADRPRLIHLSGEGETSWFEFAKAILARDPERARQRATRVIAITTDAYPTAARRPRYATLNCSLADRTFELSRPHWTRQLDDAMRELPSTRTI